jgi:STE24 endopeptidase
MRSLALRSEWRPLALGLLLAMSVASASAQTPVLQVPPGAEASPAFDAARATARYLASVPPDKKARSDAYFEGGYWLQLWNVLDTVVGAVGAACVRLVGGDA